MRNVPRSSCMIWIDLVYIYMMHMICIMYGRSYHSGNPFEGSMGP